MTQREENGQVRRLQHAARQIVQRYANCKVSILNRTLPRYLLYVDGRLETVYPLEVVGAFAKIDAACREELEALCGGLSNQSAMQDTVTGCKFGSAPPREKGHQ